MDFREPQSSAGASPFRDTGMQFPPTDVPRQGVSAKTCLTVLLLMGGGLLFLVCVGVGVFVTWNRSASRDVVEQGSGVELRKEASAAFAQFDATQEPASSDAAGEELRDIKRLLRKIERAAKRDDNEAFHELVDDTRLLKRIEATGGLDDWTPLDKYQLKKQFREGISVQAHWSRLQLANVITSPGDPDSRVLYTFGWDGNDDQVEFRWYAATVGDAWKVYDWERLDLGLSESVNWGLCAQYQSDPRMQNYVDALDAFSRSDKQLEQDNEEGAAETLKLAEPINVPPEFADYCWVLLGYRWSHMGNTEQALKCFNSVKQPDAIPGTYMGRMICFDELGEVDKAIAAGNRYEAMLGPSPQMLERKAGLLARAKRNEEAIDDWKKLLRLDPDHEMALRQTLTLLPAERITEASILLDRSKDPARIAAHLGRSLLYGSPETAKYLLDYVQSKAPDSAAAGALAGFVAEYDGEWEQAAEFYQKAFRAEHEPDTKSQYINNFTLAMAESGRLVAGYEAVPDQPAAFSALTYAYQEGDVEISEQEYRALLERHRELHPDDPWGAYYAVDLALEKKDYEIAEAMIRQVLLNAANSEDEYITPALQNQLAQVMFETDRTLEAYRELASNESIFEILARMASGGERWDELRSLMAEHRVEHPDDELLDYYAGQQAARNEHWAIAEKHYRSGLAKVSTEEDWRFRYALTESAIANGNWREFYNQAEDHDTAFRDLSSQFQQARDWESLDLLISWHREHSPDDAVLAFHQATSLWEQGRVADSVEHFAIAATSDSIEPWRRRQAGDKQLLALVRLNRMDEARQLAKQLQDERESALPLAVIEAIAGNEGNAMRLAMEGGQTSDWVGGVYRHPEAGWLLLGDGYRELHDKHPPELHWDLGRTEVVLGIVLKQNPSFRIWLNCP